MWRGETATCLCATINCEASTSRASGSASPPFTTFSSRGLTARRLRSGFSVRSRARCLQRFWHRWNWRPRLCVHLDEPKVADPMIEALSWTAAGGDQRAVWATTTRALAELRAERLVQQPLAGG